MRIWNKITGDPWAITETALQTILEVSARENETPQAVAAKLGRDLQNTYSVTMRDSVAIIPVTGPLFRYANLFTSISGASSYELIAQDFTSALENVTVKSIILDIDSPGGEVNGVSELASMIYEARGKKPIIAYASGDAASGAYWIASSADEIVVSETSALGSIGVVGIYNGKSNDKESIEIVSSQSPHKRLDPLSNDGRAKLQTRIDDMADVFIANVARNRKTTADIVKSNFGGGDVMIGTKAVTAGLANRVGSLENLILELSTTIDKEKTNMDIETLNEQHQDLVVQIKTTAVTDEKKRLKDIIGCEEAKGRENLAQQIAVNTSISAEEAITLLSAAPIEKETKATSSFEKVMASIPNPEITPDGNEEDANNIEAIATRIASST